jgi:hypothetical protein
VLDKTYAQIDQSFMGFCNVTNFFGALKPKNIVKLSEAEILKISGKLEKH